jgi:acetyl esterase/lipase
VSTGAAGLRNAIPLSALPVELREQMARVGPIWAGDLVAHVEGVWAMFAPLLQAAPSDGVTVTRDMSYGVHPRQRLDVYRPIAVKADAPVVIFVHGGAYVRGDKDNGSGGYGNVLTWFARQGYLGINVEYRLAPEIMYPDGAHDIAAAVAWAKAEVPRYGGDPTRMFLIGHSAGGTHTGGYVFDPAVGYLGRDIRGQALISARLRADVTAANPTAFAVRAYFGPDEASYEAKSPISHGAESAVPTFIATAEFENPLLDIYGAELCWRMTAARRKVRFMQLTGHNHASIIAHFNTAEEILGAEIVRFFKSIS